MNRMTDQDYLKNEQYRQPDHLSARATLHQRFARQAQPWLEWVFDQLQLEEGMHVLEVGCGPAWLWRENQNRIPANTHIILTDLSAGMVEEAHRGLNGDPRFTYQVGDVQSLDWPDGTFQRVVANHMLYHVPDLGLAIKEIHRVLVPGGQLCAATNGAGHMLELYQLLDAALPQPISGSRSITRYSLENAPQLLGELFETVEVRRLPSILWIPSVDPLVEYIRSMWMVETVSDRDLEQIRSEVQAEIDQKGGFEIHGDAGVVLARKAA